LTLFPACGLGVYQPQTTKRASSPPLVHQPRMTNDPNIDRLPHVEGDLGSGETMRITMTLSAQCVASP
ncbi:hypothetical protein, partial [Methylobacterium ajmalii]|uniref:hypothetical protein n=1 Tax=Methylobacterium ajmalii TaxID=2738439 RepID=UPI001AEEFB94